MTHTYKLVNGTENQLVCIQRSDGCSIPIDQGNTDYRNYLLWLQGKIWTPEGIKQISEPNTPEPADPILESESN